MDKHNLNSLNPAKFTELIKNREIAIASAPFKMPDATGHANDLYKRLHPNKQYLRVHSVINHKNAKTFILKPSEEKGTKECAYFSAGQYLSVFIEKDGKVYSRPYSIVSSPKESLAGTYMITVKSVDGGLVSNTILKEWQTGTEVTVSDPIGNFTYEPLRDAHHVVGIAGGSGITPFVSLAKAARDGDEDCSLTIIYASRSEDDILFKNELDALAESSDRIKVIYVLSHQHKEGFEQGFVTSELISKYAEGQYSVFICGPQQMVSFVDKELEKLSLEKKYIRHEVHGEVADPAYFAEYPSDVPENVRITVKVKDQITEIKASTKNTILRILEQNSITPPSRCRSGECGFCRSRLISGRVFVPEKLDKRRQADNKFGYFHPCCSYPLSDLVIEVTEA